MLRGIREDEDATAALGKDVFAYKLQSLALAAALAAVAGFFVALNVTYLYPTVFDPTFTFFGYALLVLGGFASYGGVALGSVLFWTLLEGARFLGIFARPASRRRCASSSSACSCSCSAGCDRRACSAMQRDEGASMSADAILEVGDAVKDFDGLRAVDGASFSVERGSITALIGPNGAGKTTMFDLLSGFARLDSGTIRFAERSIGGLAPHRIARLGMVRTFQLTRVLAGMSVIDNMLLAAPRQPGDFSWG